MLVVLDQFWSPVVHVTRLHNYNPYTCVTTSTYYTLARADFSAIIYCLKSSHTVVHAKSSLHTANLSPRSHSANSLLHKHWLLHSHSGNCFLKTALVELLPKNCIDVSVWLINPQIALAALLPVARSVSQLLGRWAVLRYRVYRRYLGNERAAVWRHRGCSQETPPLTVGERIWSRWLPSNAPLRNPTAGWHVTLLPP
jgi:hypothetical protein